MAQVLDSFGAAYRAPTKYPWHEWLDGRPWRLTKGVDFDCCRITMKKNGHGRARLRGFPLMTKMDGSDAIVIQAIRGVWTPPEGEES